MIINQLQSATKITERILGYVIGILGPLIIFTIYLVFCIFFIESPYFDASYSNVLDQMAKEEIKAECQIKLVNLLKGKGYKLQDNPDNPKGGSF